MFCFTAVEFESSVC